MKLICLTLLVIFHQWIKKQEVWNRRFIWIGTVPLSEDSIWALARWLYQHLNLIIMGSQCFYVTSTKTISWLAGPAHCNFNVALELQCSLLWYDVHFFPQLPIWLCPSLASQLANDLWLILVIKEDAKAWHQACHSAPKYHLALVSIAYLADAEGTLMQWSSRSHGFQAGEEGGVQWLATLCYWKQQYFPWPARLRVANSMSKVLWMVVSRLGCAKFTWDSDFGIITRMFTAASSVTIQKPSSLFLIHSPKCLSDERRTFVPSWGERIAPCVGVHNEQYNKLLLQWQQIQLAWAI